MEPKEQCPQTAGSVHVQHEPQAVSCTPLRAGSRPKAEKQLRRERVTRRASAPLSSFSMRRVYREHV